MEQDISTKSTAEKTDMMTQLLSLSLFQGLTREKLMLLLEKVKLDFRHVSHYCVLRQGDLHDSVVFVLRGTVRREVELGACRFTEELTTPTLLEMCSLFGRDTSLRASYYIDGEGDLLVFEKQYLYTVFNRFEIIQLNILNILSARSQRMEERLRRPVAPTLEGKVMQLVENFSDQPGGEKHLFVNREDLADMLDVNRRALSQAIVGMERKGLLRIAYSELIFPGTQS